VSPKQTEQDITSSPYQNLTSFNKEILLSHLCMQHRLSIRIKHHVLKIQKEKKKLKQQKQ
jgi:uncharacterized membrane protein YjjP (DUF1212 family)